MSSGIDLEGTITRALDRIEKNWTQNLNLRDEVINKNLEKMQVVIEKNINEVIQRIDEKVLTIHQEVLNMKEIVVGGNGKGGIKTEIEESKKWRNRLIGIVIGISATISLIFPKLGQVLSNLIRGDQ